MTSGVALPASSGKRAVATACRRAWAAAGRHQPAGDGAYAGGQVGVGAHDGNPKRQAGAEQVRRHRSASGRLRHTRGQSGCRRRRDAHCAPHLSLRQVGRRDQHLRLRARTANRSSASTCTVERDTAGVEEYIKRFIPTSEVKVELINDNVVLTGTVDTPLDAARAAQIANMLVSGGEATTGQYSQTAAASSDGGGVDIDNPDVGAPGQRHRQPDPDHRRRPGDA